MIPRIKVCCIKSVHEVWVAVQNGASAVGLVSEMPSGPGVIAEDAIAAIAAAVPPGVASFLLTSLTNPEAIVAQHERCRTNTVQLVDRVDGGAYAVLRESLPGIKVVQVVHITGPESLDEAIQVAPFVDGLLLDSGNQVLDVKELGGTGRIHDWSISRSIVEAVDVPVYLAGGLKPENVAEAVRAVRPFGLDVCSGLRDGFGTLVPERLEAFRRAASEA